MNYLLLVAIPNIGVFFTILGILGILFCVVGFFVFLSKKQDAYSEKDHKECDMYQSYIIKMFIASIIMLFVTCFIPERNQIIQLKIIDAVSELKGIDDIPQKLIDKLNNLLNENKDE